MNQRQVNSTNYPMLFFMPDSLNPSKGKTGLTPTVTISKNGGSFASPSGAVTELANGWYALAGNATDRDTVGKFIIHAKATGADDVNQEYEITTHDPFNVSGGSGGATAQQVWEYATRSLTDKAGFSLATASVQAIWEYTTRVLTAGTNIGFPTAQNIWEYTSRILTAGTNIGFPDASSIATAVWSATTRTLSSFGSIVTDIAAAVWSAAVRTITGGNKDATIDAINAITNQITFTDGKVDANASVSLTVDDIADIADGVAAAIKLTTGWTEGGTLTYAEVVKIIASAVAGKVIDKAGVAGTVQHLDVEDKTTPIFENIPSNTTSPYRDTTIL